MTDQACEICRKEPRRKLFRPQRSAQSILVALMEGQMRFALAIGLTVLASSVSWGASVTGKQVFEGCKEAATQRASYERGVCSGIAHAVGSFGDVLPLKNCIPKGVTVNESTMALYVWLRNHPERLQEPIVDLAMYAFAQAWPCNKS